MINNLVHMDIGVTDLEKAKKFYETIFNWKIYKLPEMPDAYFFSVDKENELAGGELSLTDNTIRTGSVILYFNVDDIESTLIKLQEIGGSVVLQKTVIPGGHGMYAQFLDPFNNKIGIWTPME
ncbi:MAG: VOC family protein [Candidatus Kariarchaeaceae archaeon]|jgi:predicted enzyme related to lactoylglutathione lyase